MDEYHKLIYGGMVTATAIIFAGGINGIMTATPRNMIAIYVVVILLLLVAILSYTSCIKHWQETNKILKGLHFFNPAGGDLY